MYIAIERVETEYKLCLFHTRTYQLVHHRKLGTAVAQWLRRCATNRKVAGSIPAGVIGIFH